MKLIFTTLGLLIFIPLTIISLYFGITLENTIWNWIIPISIISLFISLLLGITCIIDESSDNEMSIYKGGGDRIWEDIENDVPYEKSYAKQLHNSFKK